MSMRPFTGDERVHAFARRLCQLAARAPVNSDAAANLRSSAQHLRRRPQSPVQSSGQFLAFQRVSDLYP